MTDSESKIRQGVTTEVAGQCGYSFFPFNESDFREQNNKIFEKQNNITVIEARNAWKQFENELLKFYPLFLAHREIKNSKFN